MLKIVQKMMILTSNLKLFNIFILISPGSDNKERIEKTEESTKEDIKPVHEEPEYPDSHKETEDKYQSKNQTKLNEDKTGNKTEKSEKEKKPITVTIKEPINAEEIKLGSKTLDEKKFSISIEK